MIITSPLLSAITNVRHGFSTRLGGVSHGAFASLNLDRGVGDEETRVAENRTRFRERLGLPPEATFIQVVQVHGTTVLDAKDAAGASADALLTFDPMVAVGVRTADCVPVLIAALDGPTHAIAVSAVHAGWRGATAGIVEGAILALETRGAQRQQLRFVLGPSIGVDAFEVGDEVIEAATRLLGGEPPPARRHPTTHKWHLDLRGALLKQLSRLGVASSHVELAGGCTHDEPALYFSHRRDHGRTGRHVSAIARVE